MTLRDSKTGELNVPAGLWRQMVRDYDGRWKKYRGLRSSITHDLYFHGHQPRPIYKGLYCFRKLEKYINATLKTRRLIIQGLTANDFDSTDSFVKWLSDLHRMQSYKGKAGKLNCNRKLISHNHSSIIRGDVIKLAVNYGDPYASGKTAGPALKNVPESALPVDVELSIGELYHYYPRREYFGHYYEELYRMYKLIRRARATSLSYVVESIAKFYQVVANLHMFEQVNNSLYMNITNALLEYYGVNGIEHGILDFVAMRLSPSNICPRSKPVNACQSLIATMDNALR